MNFIIIFVNNMQIMKGKLNKKEGGWFTIKQPKK